MSEANHPTPDDRLFPSRNRRVSFGCFWPTGCSDSTRCNAHGSCVADAQARTAVNGEPVESEAVTSNTSADPLRDALERLLSLYKEADDERYKEQMEHRAEAQELQKKGDGYGFNFYSGMDAGLNWTALFFYRVRRGLEAMIKALPKEPEIQRVYKLVDHWHGEAIRWESEEKKRRGEIEQLTRERDEACNKLSALHEGEGSPDETSRDPYAELKRLRKQMGEIAVLLLQNDRDEVLQWARGVKLHFPDGAPELMPDNECSCPVKSGELCPVHHRRSEKASERYRVKPPKFCAVDECYNRVADDQEVCDSCSQNGNGDA